MRFSLGTKVVIVFVTFAVILSGVAMAVSFGSIEEMNEAQYKQRADEISATVASVIDADDLYELAKGAGAIYDATDDHVTSDEWGSPAFEAYVGHFAPLEKTPEYQRILAQLSALQATMDVDCLYTTLIIPEDEAVVYLVDAAEEDACPIGCIDPLYDFNREAMSDPNAGMPAYITDTPGYGWLVTAGTPVISDDGAVVGYAFVDISMDVIKQREATHLINLGMLLVAITVAVCVGMILLVRRILVQPLNTLSQAAMRYCTPDERGASTFEGLNIRNTDEIGELYHSMIQMEHDIDSYINNLVETRARLRDTRLEAERMSSLAHTDSLTGARNRRAYDEQLAVLNAGLAKGDAEFGIVVVDMNDLKRINDTYGHDCGNVSLTLLSDAISGVYAHSQVYRIGGDEFVVVLRGYDYHKAGALEEELRRVFAHMAGVAAHPWEAVSAAVGSALFNPALDANADTVFRRADELMYQDKKRSKEGVVRS